MNMKNWKLIQVGMIMLASLTSTHAAEADFVEPSIDYAAFLGNHDMEWNRIPNRWEVAPYSGNGNVGFTFYQAKGSAKNVISIFTGRHDYYDHRLPHEGQQHLWIYRCRLPLGHFNVTSQGDITAVDLRLDLWNAELTGTVQTSKGAYQVRALTHRTNDVIYFETDASDGESIQISWHPDQAKSSVRNTLESGGGPKGGTWDTMRTTPHPLPPEPVLSEIDGMQFCLQALFQHRGETTTGWETLGAADGKQVLLASVHHSFPEKNSLATVRANLNQAKQSLAVGELVASHRKWWHAYYPQSFLTINDAEKEAFYWIQMYKLGSAMSEDGPILDVMGPWYHYTFWPMVWGDLNVQLIYWTHLTANRMSVGASLPNNLDKYAFNLSKNVPARWKDSMALGPLFPQDCLSFDNGKTPDMLAWVLHNYWLHCEYAGDRERMRDGLFPLLRKNVNGYLNYLRENPVQSDDGKIHIKMSWSPEYPGGHGQDVNFTIGLLRWACSTLLDINAEHALDDPLAAEWQNILDHLVDYQIDDKGLRIGKDIPFDKPHRHYSHLLPFFPLAEITPENPEDAKMLRTSLDHWLDVSINGVQKDNAMAVTGYTATGAASMYARLGATEKAAYYLNFLINHKNISPTTMYAEGNPVIETPLSFASSVHDMVLQSWGGKIRVFNGTPKAWSDVAFHQLRTEGAFLVSAKKQGGVTQFVSVESLVGAPCLVQTDLLNPKVSINGQAAKRGLVTKTTDGFYKVALKKGDTVTFTPMALKHADLSIEPIPVSAANRNLFGLNDKSARLSGHQFYYPETAPSEPKPAAVKSTKRAKGSFPGQLQKWHGFDMYVNGGTRVVVPKQVADGKPWVWRARFWGHEPQFDIAMLERGYHVVYCDVGGLFGNAEAVARWNAFYDYLRYEHLFADRVVLEGMSRGGLIVYNWAAANPEKVAAIYADAPVMDFKSWPGINKQILTRYGFKDEQEAEAYALNPVDHLAPLAKAGIPILHVVGDADDVVPVADNTALAEARYKKMGGIFEVIHKPDVGHHPHSLKDPQPIVDFVLRHSGGKADLSAEDIVSDKNFILRGDFNNSRIQFE
jgi:alpha-L-fucosidase 2